MSHSYMTFGRINYYKNCGKESGILEIFTRLPLLTVQIIFCTTPRGTVHCKNCSLIIETIFPQIAGKCLEERVPLSNLHKVTLLATGKGDSQI